MSARPSTKLQPYAPDYVSADTLAYRLDCSRSTVDDYVRRGLLPKPRSVGNLQRWRWSDIEAWIAATSDIAMDVGTTSLDDHDPYIAGVKRVATSQA